MEAILFEFLAIFIEYLTGVYFTIYILKEQFKLSKKTILTGAMITITIYSVISTIVSNLPVSATVRSICYTLTGIIWMLITYQLLSYVTKEEKGRLLFLMFACNNITVLYNAVTLFCYSVFAPDLLTADYSLIDLIGFGVPALILFPLLTPIIKRYYLAMRALGSQVDQRLWMIPFFFYILSASQTNLYPADEYIWANATKISIILCAFITYSQMFNAIIKTANAAKESEFKRQLQSQLKAEQARIKDLESYMEEIRRIRHDHRQHLQVLRGFLEADQTNDMIAYLNDYEASIQQSIKPPLCEHRITDALCRRYEALATQSNINVKININLPQNVYIHGGDLAVILGNLWENAISAALDAEEANNFIHLSIYTKQNTVMIKMENGYNGNIYCVDDKFLSTKDNRHDEEGIGINSIKSIAESYGGIVDFAYTENVFTASILLYIQH